MLVAAGYRLSDLTDGTGPLARPPVEVEGDRIDIARVARDICADTGRLGVQRSSLELDLGIRIPFLPSRAYRPIQL